MSISNFYLFSYQWKDKVAINICVLLVLIREINSQPDHNSENNEVLLFSNFVVVNGTIQRYQVLPEIPLVINILQSSSWLCLAISPWGRAVFWKRMRRVGLGYKVRKVTRYTANMVNWITWVLNLDASFTKVTRVSQLLFYFETVIMKMV